MGKLRSALAVQLHLGPVVHEAELALEKHGVTLADRVPDVETTVTVARVDAIPMIRTVDRVAAAFGLWLPIVSFGLLGGGAATVIGLLVARAVLTVAGVFAVSRRNSSESTQEATA